MISIQMTNEADFIAGIQEKCLIVRDAITAGMSRVTDEMRDSIKDGQLSGRPGLEIQTGNLYNSIKSKVEEKTKTVTGIVFNRKADYWWYHQYPEGGRHKYLNIDEYFELEGAEMVSEMVEDAMLEFA